MSDKSKFNYDKYTSSYDESSLWEKIKKFSKSAGEELIKLALELFYALNDPSTSLPTKTLIIAALGYFISPIDAIPDIIPIAGYTDDLGVLTLAAANATSSITDEHKKRAEEKLNDIF